MSKDIVYIREHGPTCTRLTVNPTCPAWGNEADALDEVADVLHEDHEHVVVCRSGSEEHCCDTDSSLLHVKRVMREAGFKVVVLDPDGGDYDLIA